MFDLARILIEALIMVVTMIEAPSASPKGNTSPAAIVAPTRQEPAAP